MKELYVKLLREAKNPTRQFVMNEEDDHKAVNHEVKDVVLEFI